MSRRADVNGQQRSRVGRTYARLRHAGFTLVEMLVTLLILAILVGVGVPTFLDATLGSRLGSAANNLVVSLHLARSEAIKRNTTVKVCPSTDGATCATSSSWQGGWIVIAPYAAGTSDDVVLQKQAALGGNISVLHKNAALSSSLTTTIDMPPSGIRAGGSDQAFLVCRATPTVGKQERLVSISPTGKPSVKRTQTGTCS
jgi:type IV fimbrial biogenesis protein FimT